MSVVSIMKMILLLVTILLILCVHMAKGRAYPRRSCGKHLADRISEICKIAGGYSQVSNTPDSINIELQSGFELYNSGNHRRSKRGIVEDCCKTSCTDVYLLSYCMTESDGVLPGGQFPTALELKTMTANIQAFPLDIAKDSAITENPVSTMRFTTSFPFKIKPMEFGTVRPEFNKLQTKYYTNLVKQSY